MPERGRLGEVLEDVMRRHNLERRARQWRALGVWAEVVGKDIARNAWPVRVRDGVLLVGVANHAWAQTLHLMRAAIVEALNARLGADALREMQVRVTGRDQRRAAADAEDHAPRRTALPPLTREEQARVREIVAGVTDPELKAKVRRAAAGLMRLRRLREAQGRRRCPRCGRAYAARERTCPACAGRR
jgi:predicted nucleic acid-binding Zn ribbon protein